MKLSFPLLAFGLGLLLCLLLLATSPPYRDSGALPLLTGLLISEFGLLVTAIAAVLGVGDLLRSERRQRHTIAVLSANLLLAGFFLYTGFRLWPGGAGGS